MEGIFGALSSHSAGICATHRRDPVRKRKDWIPAPNLELTRRNPGHRLLVQSPHEMGIESFSMEGRDTTGAKAMSGGVFLDLSAFAMISMA